MAQVFHPCILHCAWNRPCMWPVPGDAPCWLPWTLVSPEHHSGAFHTAQFGSWSCSQWLGLPSHSVAGMQHSWVG